MAAPGQNPELMAALWNSPLTPVSLTERQGREQKQNGFHFRWKIVDDGLPADSQPIAVRRVPSYYDI